MEWLVQLAGDDVYLEELSRSLKNPELSIIKENEAYTLKSVDFSRQSTEDEVRKKASEILSLINGCSMIVLGARRPIEIARVVRVNDDGTRASFVHISARLTLVGEAKVRILNRDGTVTEVRPADVIPSMLKAAQSSDSVAKVLRLLGTGTHDWGHLYKIYELVKNDVGGRSKIVQNGWATEIAIKRFTQTANSPAVIGDSARHAVEPTKPPKNPMSFEEARSLIEGMIHGWFDLHRA
jgi:hypothetical protein